MKKPDSGTWSIIPSLVLPVFLGLLFYFALSWLIDGGTIKNELVVRYLTGHPVSWITTGMFCVGLAALLLAGKFSFDQWVAGKRINLNYTSDELQLNSRPVSHDGELANRLIDRLLMMPRRYREFFAWGRLFDAVNFVGKSRSTLGLDQELKYLADLDADRRAENFSLVKILIWATPMLGFLGTVLGISQALGSLNVGPDNDFQQMLGGLRSSLYVAFDTTALALTFSITLMFMMFLVERFDANLLDGVDAHVRAELERHFDVTAVNKEPATVAVEQVGKEVLLAVGSMTESQSRHWEQAIQSSLKSWQQALKHSSMAIASKQESANDEIVRSLQQASCQLHDSVYESLDKAEEVMDHRWKQLQTAITNNARLLQRQQDEMGSQTQILSDAVEQLKTALETHSEQEADSDQHFSRLFEMFELWQKELVSLKGQVDDGSRDLKLRIVRPVQPSVQAPVKRAA